MPPLNTLYKTWLAVLLIALATNLPAKQAIHTEQTIQPEQKSAPKVLATIKPLQLISQAITHGVSDTEILLPPGASPHDYSLKFSDQRKLHSADIILWIGPDMETFLGKVLDNSKNKIAMEMMAINGISQRKEHDKHHHDDEEHDAHHGHHHGEFDPHIWLSTKNALAMAHAIHNKLQEVDKNKGNRERYTANLHLFEARLKAADERNKKKLEKVKQKPFFVFHDAYGHLQDRYDLNVAGHFTINPQQQPGARHLEKIRGQLKAAGNTCVFREPQFQPSYIDRLTEGLPVKVGVLDPLASDVARTEEGYITFINSMVDSISSCLNTSTQIGSSLI